MSSKILRRNQVDLEKNQTTEKRVVLSESEVRPETTKEK